MRHGLSSSNPGSPPDRHNNFDALRLFAALAVVVSHAWGMAVAPDAQPAVGDIDLGTLGVRMFFGISGFLIAQSWLADPDLFRFTAKRALRIMPALLVVLAVTTLVLGPAVTALPVGQYLTDGRTWSYALGNAVFSLHHELPGVFTTHLTREVNGPLWTLGPEVLSYAGLAAAGVAGALRRWWIAPLVAAVLIAIPRDPTGMIPWDHRIWLFQTFAVGASLYVLRDRIPWHPGIVVAGLAAFALTRGGPQDLMSVTVIPYATIFLAYRGPAALRRLTRHGDVSYGLYLIGWPAGQAVIALSGGRASPWVVLAVSLPAAYLLALASWKLVEQPALAYKKRLVGRSLEPRAPAAAPRAGVADS